MSSTLSYKHDGVSHPLIEADYDTAFKCYKSDRRKATIGDPTACIEALGLRRLPNVEFAHIGAGGDAYVGFKDPDSATGITVRHFVIPAQSKRVRDSFDVKGSPPTQILMLKAPSNGRTISHRRTLNKKRRIAVKAGAPIKKRQKPSKTRITKLGISKNRARAKVEAGEVSIA